MYGGFDKQINTKIQSFYKIARLSEVIQQNTLIPQRSSKRLRKRRVAMEGNLSFILASYRQI